MKDLDHTMPVERLHIHDDIPEDVVKQVQNFLDACHEQIKQTGEVECYGMFAVTRIIDGGKPSLLYGSGGAMPTLMRSGLQTVVESVYAMREFAGLKE